MQADGLSPGDGEAIRTGSAPFLIPRMSAFHRLPSRPSNRDPLALRSEDVFRLVLLFVPTALLLCFGRLAEFAGVQGSEGLARMLWTDVPVPTALVACSAVSWVVVYRAAGRYAELAATVAALVVGGGGAMLLRLLLPWWVTSWLDPQALGFLRTDLALVLAAVVAIAVALATVRRSRLGRKAAWGLAHGLAAAVAAVVVADLAVLLGTGARGGYFAVRDFLLDPIHLAPVVMSEMTVGGVVLLALPLAITLLPLLTARRSGAARRRAIPVRRVVLVCGPLLGLSVVPVGPGDPSAIVRMATMTWEEYRWDGADMASMRLDENPYDLRNARLVATDSTRALNVVVLVLESVRRSAVTPYAPDLPTTPFLDSLARNGLLVEGMHTPVSYTNKALVSIFGGIPPSPDSRIVEALPGGIPSPGLPRLLREHGYRSAFFTPATLAFERKDQILENLGFDEAYGDGAYEREGFEEKAYFGYEDRIVLDKTLAWAGERAEHGDPFFLGMLTLTAHHPYDVPDDAVRLGLEPDHEDLGAYYDAVRYTDDFVRELFDGFERRGLLDSTVFVIVGDHGEAFGEHDMMTHGNILWEEVLQVPAIVYGPGLIPEAQRVPGPRLLTDIVPTVAAMLNLRWEGPQPPGFSLLGQVPAERPLVHAYKDGRVALALRRGTKKYLFEYHRRSTRVFDLATDPAERHDLAARTAPGEVQSAEHELLNWVEAVQHAYWLAREAAGVDRDGAPPSGRRLDMLRRELPTAGP